MKLKKNNSGYLFYLLLVCFIIGSLAWDIFGKIMLKAGIDLSLTTPPIGIDLDVLKLMVRVNPGSFIGLVAGIIIFRGI